MEVLTPVILALGSNMETDAMFLQARSLLTQLFDHKIFFTLVLMTEPIDFGKRKFRNALASASTPLSLPEVQRSLKVIERSCGRTPEGKARGEITIDIDLMLFGSQKFHLSDWDRPYIRELMKELPVGK